MLHRHKYFQIFNPSYLIALLFCWPCVFRENLINLCHMLALSKLQTSAEKKTKQNSTTGLTSELFHLSPCNVMRIPRNLENS